MKKMAWITLVYAVLILVGGWMGHAKSGSQASLIAGLISGLLLIMAAVPLFYGKRMGAYAAITIAIALDAFFLYRLVVTHKVFPAGVMSIISGVVSALLLILFLKRAAPQHPN